MDSDELDSDLLARGLERVRVARLRWVILIGMCVVVAVLFGMAGARFWQWWPLRMWMIPALLIPVGFVLLALFHSRHRIGRRWAHWDRRADEGLSPGRNDLLQLTSENVGPDPEFKAMAERYSLPILGARC